MKKLYRTAIASLALITGLALPHAADATPGDRDTLARGAATRGTASSSASLNAARLRPSTFRANTNANTRRALIRNGSALNRRGALVRNASGLRGANGFRPGALYPRVSSTDHIAQYHGAVERNSLSLIRTEGNGLHIQYVDGAQHFSGGESGRPVFARVSVTRPNGSARTVNVRLTERAGMVGVYDGEASLASFSPAELSRATVRFASSNGQRVASDTNSGRGYPVVAQR